MGLPHLLIPMYDAAISPLTISSPTKHIKFLFSHGGKILPRPADGQLKYVGGETRLISVATDISFQQLMKKLSLMSCKGEIILKYQVVSEDLDALVTVKSDEDVVHMFDEINNWENARRGSRLRAFLFLTNPNQMDIDPLQLEQRFIDAINGVCRQYLTTVQLQHGSAGSSPTSPDSCTNETTNNYDMNNQIISMHKVRSLPNICGTNFPSQQQNNHYIHQVQHQHYQSPKPVAPHLHKSEKLVSMKSVRKKTRGNGHCMKCSLHNSTHFSDTRLLIDRTRSRAMSPVPLTTPNCSCTLG